MVRAVTGFNTYLKVLNSSFGCGKNSIVEENHTNQQSYVQNTLPARFAGRCINTLMLFPTSFLHTSFFKEKSEMVGYILQFMSIEKGTNVSQKRKPSFVDIHSICQCFNGLFHLLYYKICHTKIIGNSCGKLHHQ